VKATSAETCTWQNQNYKYYAIATLYFTLQSYLHDAILSTFDFLHTVVGLFRSRMMKTKGCLRVKIHIISIYFP